MVFWEVENYSQKTQYLPWKQHYYLIRAKSFMASINCHTISCSVKVSFMQYFAVTIKMNVLFHLVLSVAH